MRALEALGMGGDPRSQRSTSTPSFWHSYLPIGRLSHPPLAMVRISALPPGKYPVVMSLVCLAMISGTIAVTKANHQLTSVWDVLNS